MEPLRVSVTLIRPISVGTYPILLDGVLAALRVELAQSQGHPDPWSTQHDLPLDLYQPDQTGPWVFKASFFCPSLQGPIDPVGFEIQTSRISLDRVAQDMEDKLVKVGTAVANPAGGTFKTHFFSVASRFVHELCAYAIGDRQGVEALLSRLRYLGGRRSTAHGRIARVQVEPVSEQECCWWDRPLPCGQTIVSKTVRAWGRLHPPYWAKQHRAEVLLPVSR